MPLTPSVTPLRARFEPVSTSKQALVLGGFGSTWGDPLAVFEIIVILSLTKQTNFQLRQFNSHNNIIVFKEDGAILIEGKFDQS